MNLREFRRTSHSPFHAPRSIGRSMVVLALVLASNALAAVAGDRRSADESLFSRQAFLDHVSYLASDELEGRGTGQEGIDKAAEYIADYFEDCGVKPAGDDGTYFQNFSLKLWKKISRGTRLKIGTDGRPASRSAKLHEDYRPFPFSSSAAFDGEVVFVGYGIVNDDHDYNDYEDIDVADKVVLMMRRAPRFAEFGMADMSFRSKSSRANARDAKAILIVNPTFDDDGDKLYSFDESSGAAFGMTPPSYGVPMLHISRAVAERMLKAGGMPDLATIEEKIDNSHEPMSTLLKGVSVKGRVKITAVESPVRNVVGLIPGKGPNKDEYIILGAHYDHLGIRHKGEEGFDPEKDISNGADDNASGTALIMTMADAYSRGRAPNRSILLMLFTGEERGLLGSAHFANKPTIDLTKATAMLNFDMIGRLRKDTLEVGGMRTGDFEEMVRDLADEHGLKVKDGGGGRGPSDHTSFYNKDIPVLFFFTGLHKQYHQPDDDTPLLNIDGAIRIAKFSADIIDAIDSRQVAPQFAKDSRRPRIGRPDDEDEDDDVAVAAAAPGVNPHEAPVSAASAGPGDGVRLGIRPDTSDTEGGILIGEVMDDTPAARTDLRAGDRLTRLDGKQVEGIEGLLEILGSLKFGDKTTAVIERDGKTLRKEIQFGEAVAVAHATEPAPTAHARPAPTAHAHERPAAGMDDALAKMDLDIARARMMLDDKRSELDQYRQRATQTGTGVDELREKVLTLTAIETELAMDMDGKRTVFEQFDKVRPEDMPITPDLQALLQKDKKIQRLEDKAAEAEEKLVEATARHKDDVEDHPDVAAARAVRDFAADRVSEERATKALQYRVRQKDQARRQYKQAQDQLLAIRERLAGAQAELQDKEQKRTAMLRLEQECATLTTAYDALVNQRRQLASVPRIAQLAQVIRDTLVQETDDFEITVKFDANRPDTTLEITLRPRSATGEKLSQMRDDREKEKRAYESALKRLEPSAARAIDAMAQQMANTNRGKTPRKNVRKSAIKKTHEEPAKKAEKKAEKDPHADMPDDVTSTPMPPVRLGIMPSYGETEGEGYEITGVVEGGAAAKAGMKDGDRIYKIGGVKVTDVYTYMDSLRKYKPGDLVPVVVLRDGKKVELKVKAEGQQSKEAA
ncbi:MAG: M28 family peptidase [Planctomycetia bacterium]|nr:M28 family peptidase [Planctomycetia bacterium]MCC7315578.1 M28 family peptidase [Planctomycetota bacterium]